MIEFLDLWLRMTWPGYAKPMTLNDLSEPQIGSWAPLREPRRDPASERAQGVVTSSTLQNTPPRGQESQT
ncbi:MAG: hypothetical protein JWR80_10013 [Bradyrhizobium sp.]|nr:hypothetical protein [Bradyrhizobium sp.]